ncbi:MAG TPA: hypothetical protein PK014_11545 [Thermoanaerobaculia bacterium]|nr:hypothetical protein [Thermoanaerobaculia bacterium]HUM30798.1 hypothetical protein [Thermoanaerobaculia bacterium]HXK69002.1 hypothetical protein [Thermoanaerobaculia bacterium]
MPRGKGKTIKYPEKARDEFIEINKSMTSVTAYVNGVKVRMIVQRPEEWLTLSHGDLHQSIFFPAIARVFGDYIWPQLYDKGIRESLNQVRIKAGILSDYFSAYKIIDKSEWPEHMKILIRDDYLSYYDVNVWVSKSMDALDGERVRFWGLSGFRSEVSDYEYGTLLKTYIYEGKKILKQMHRQGEIANIGEILNYSRLNKNEEVTKQDQYGSCVKSIIELILHSYQMCKDESKWGNERTEIEIIVHVFKRIYPDLFKD